MLPACCGASSCPCPFRLRFGASQRSAPDLRDCSVRPASSEPGDIPSACEDRRVQSGPGWWAPHKAQWWIAILFALGSACFAIGPFPGFLQAVGAVADAAVFFAGSIAFTCAAALQFGTTPGATAGTVGPTACNSRGPSSSTSVPGGRSTRRSTTRPRTVWSGGRTSAVRCASWSRATSPASACRGEPARSGSRRSTWPARCSSVSPRWRPTWCRRPATCWTSPPRTGPRPRGALLPGRIAPAVAGGLAPAARAGGRGGERGAGLTRRRP